MTLMEWDRDNNVVILKTLPVVPAGVSGVSCRALTSKMRNTHTRNCVRKTKIALTRGIAHNLTFSNQMMELR